MKKLKKKSKYTFKLNQQTLAIVISILAVAMAALLILVLWPKSGQEAERTLPESSEEEAEPELVITCTGKSGATMTYVEQDDGLYLNFDTVNSWFMDDALFIDTAHEKVYHTTLAGGKQVTDFADLKLITALDTLFIQMDQASSLYNFTAAQESEYEIVLSRNAVDLQEPELPSVYPQGPVKLLWYQDYSSLFNEEKIETVSMGLGQINALSPTWFSLDENGSFISYYNADWVSWAHENGMQIWPLFDNGMENARTLKAIAEEESRDQLIQQILSVCEELQLDGINLDFELLSEEAAGYFVEFVRELGAVLRPAGYVLSVDVSVPQDWSYYYRRDLLSQASDYIIVMAYDEHYVGGSAGSVSSISFTENAVADMLASCEKEKVILGVPFYTRIWAMQDTGTTSEAWSMTKVQNYIEELALEVKFDEATGQNYVSYEEDGVFYEIWIEDATSMEKRLQIAQDNKLAGIACWKAGLETEEIWELIAQIVVSEE